MKPTLTIERDIPNDMYRLRLVVSINGMDYHKEQFVSTYELDHHCRLGYESFREYREYMLKRITMYMGKFIAMELTKNLKIEEVF